MDSQQPSIGRIVHYVARGSADGVYKPVCVAAVVTEVTADASKYMDDPMQASLCVFNPSGLFFNRDVAYDEDKKPGTWHWPERT